VDQAVQRLRRRFDQFLLGVGQGVRGGGVGVQDEVQGVVVVGDLRRRERERARRETGEEEKS
jgi:hypothetical protein